MRIAVISDVHANLPALRAVLADINAVAPDAVVSCGDLAAGPLPHPTIDLLRGLDIPVYCVRGNADRAMIETFDGTADPAGILMAWASIQLTRDERGHAHMQFDRQAGRYRLVNAGSVGMPYGQSGAY